MDKKALNGYKKVAILLFLFIAVSIFRNVAFDVVVVAGDSMNNSFFQGDALLAKADTSHIERFDVVVAKVQGQKIIKRVIALPQETIQIQNGAVYVNGEEIVGSFDFVTENAGIANEPYTLNDGEYFLMGDNRSRSYDSRYFGGVNIKDIKLVVVYKF